MNDLSEELIEFLNYVEHSDEKTAQQSKGSLVKNVHRRVINVKNDTSVEVEFMTLLERDREKIEEGKVKILIKQLTKKFKHLPNEYIQNLSKSTDETLDKIAEDIFDIESLNDLDKYF